MFEMRRISGRNAMKLSAIVKGACVRIVSLPEGDIRSQCIRIGLMEGSAITCLERLPGGTLVLRHCRQELALSADLADGIMVALK